MNFLAPTAFALAILLPILVAMYLLKLRRSEQVVPSVYLWRRMVRDVEANAPWQRLRRNLLLFLQLLFLAALILALARPFTWSEGAAGQSAILILDTSASMAATDLAPTRLEAAKARAHQLVDSLPDDARQTIIAAGQSAQVLAASSQDRRLVHNAIDSIQATATGSDMATALQLASAIAARQPETEILVLSDGRFDLPDRLALKGRLRYLPFGLSGENQAISLLTLTPPPGGSGLTAFAQVINYGEQPAERRVELYADGRLVNAFDLQIPPQEQRPILAEDLPPDTRLVEARLDRSACPDACASDSLPIDDTAWAVYRGAPPAAVALVTEGNLYLETALTLLPGIEVTSLRPADYEASRESAAPSGDLPALASFDLTIFDNYVPIGQSRPPPDEETAPAAREPESVSPVAESLPAGNLFFIAPPRSSAFFTLTGIVEQPFLRPVDLNDPLLVHVNLAGVNVLDAARLQLPEWARPVVSGDLPGESAPLLFAGPVDGRRVAVLAFDLHRSDLPLQVAFPLLLANLVGWLAPGHGADLPVALTPGAPLSLSLPLDVESATVTRPDGSHIQIQTPGGRLAFAGTDQLGVYQVAWGEAGRLEFAVNLFSPAESDIRPAENLPALGAAAAQGGELPQQARQEWWRPLAFVALAILVLEWLVYHRGTLARLRTWLSRSPLKTSA